MWRMAVIFRPLFSNRRMISPVRPRAKASGFTRMRVRSMWSFDSGVSRSGRRFNDRPRPTFETPPSEPSSLRATLRRRCVVRDRRLIRRLATSPAACGRGRGGAGLRLAVGAELPGGVDRLPARVAGVLELAHAARAAQVVALDLVVAVRAQLVVEVR